VRRAPARRAILVLAGLALALAAVLAGCGVPESSRARSVDDEDVPRQLLESATTVTTGVPGGGEQPPVTPPVPSDPVQVFFVAGQPGRIVPVIRRVPLPVEPQAVMAALVNGPDPAEAADQLRSALVGLPELLEVEGGTATVRLPPEQEATRRSEQVLALAQLVLTLTGLPGVDEVVFELDDRPAAVPLADPGQGLSAAGEPVGREDYEALLGSP